MSLKLKVVESSWKKSVEAFKTLVDFKVSDKHLAQLVRSEMLNLRSGNAHTKTRGEIRGTGKKPWRQKGTGRARHGSRRSPIWVGGGITFGPRNTRNWHSKINKTARLSALKAVIVRSITENKAYILEEKFEFLKTKLAQPIIDLVAAKSNIKPKSITLVYTSEDKEAIRGFVNTEISLVNAANLKIFKLIQSRAIVFTPNAKDFLENRLSK